jgi:hypothetical protein
MLPTSDYVKDCAEWKSSSSWQLDPPSLPIQTRPCRFYLKVPEGYLIGSNKALPGIVSGRVRPSWWGHFS